MERSAQNATDESYNCVLTLRLGAESDLPLNTFGYFVASRTQGLIPMPGGSIGTLCLSGNIGRYVGPGQIQSSGTSGRIAIPIDTAAMPTPTGLVQAAVGDTWNFQCWFRDGFHSGTFSNFTDGLEITFE